MSAASALPNVPNRPQALSAQNPENDITELLIIANNIKNKMKAIRNIILDVPDFSFKKSDIIRKTSDAAYPSDNSQKARIKHLNTIITTDIQMLIRLNALLGNIVSPVEDLEVIIEGGKRKTRVKQLKHKHMKTRKYRK